MFRKVLIANRGAIACRIIRTLKALGVQSVAVYSEADAQARHVREADEAYLLGPAPAAESYLKADRILQIARDCGAQAIHPGYGFLSENPAFAQACEDAGIAFIGPTAAQMRAFGLKHTARELALLAGDSLMPAPADSAAARSRRAAPARRSGQHLRRRWRFDRGAASPASRAGRRGPSPARGCWRARSNRSRPRSGRAGCPDACGS